MTLYADSDSRWKVQLRVLGALVLRDMRTRAGRNHTGFVVSIFYPFLHIGTIIAVYAILGRTVPMGTSPLLFFTTGLVPYIIFMYVSRNTVMAYLFGAPLLYFPTVKLLDLFVARAILEAVTAMAIVLLCSIMLYVSIGVGMPPDPIEVMYALLVTLLFSIGMGFLNGAITALNPKYITTYSLFLILGYMTSGLFFLPESVPEAIQKYLLYNPLLHMVMWYRSAYYDNYGVNLLDKPYAVTFAAATLVLGLIAERLVRGRVLSQ